MFSLPPVSNVPSNSAHFGDTSWSYLPQSVRISFSVDSSGIINFILINVTRLGNTLEIYYLVYFFF